MLCAVFSFSCAVDLSLEGPCESQSERPPRTKPSAALRTAAFGDAPMELSSHDEAGPSSTTRRDAAASLSPEQQQAQQRAAASALEVKVARRMFWWGFAALPGLWLLVWVHFRAAAKQPHSDPRLRVYVHRLRRCHAQAKASPGGQRWRHSFRNASHPRAVQRAALRFASCFVS